MEYQLTVPAILRRAEALFAEKEIISRLPDKSIHRYTYRYFAARVKQLAVALAELGVQPGDRVATLSWNHYQHLEAYYAIPSMGAVIHPLNLRLTPDDLTYIINHAEDKIIIIDEVLLPLFEKFKSGISVTAVIVVPQLEQALPDGYLNYEDILAGADAARFKPVEENENCAAFMCYTSGTTGRPKGILYSHRSIVLHAMSSLISTCGPGITGRDVVLPVVPMFHASAWGFPYICTFAGATQVFPGPYLDADSLLELFEAEKVTITGGVPTVMLNLLHKLDGEPHKYNLSLRTIMLGGSATPLVLVKSFAERYGIYVLSTWGMTEISPLGTTALQTSKQQKASREEQYNDATKQGFPVLLLEVRARSESGIIAWDGETMGELELRGPCVAGSYYKETGNDESFTSDGWFKTGDIATINEDGCIEVRDRSKDVIKSGGEWISSVALENALMDHPAVLEAAVIGVPDPKWIERPFAYVVLKEGKAISTGELNAFLAARVAKFWLPDNYEITDAIPKTSVGKYLKSALRERYAQKHKD